jgi:phosphohistidine swiveling domain-containing protein
MKVSAKVIRNPGYLKEVYKKFIPIIRELISFSEFVNKKDFSNLSSQEIWKLYQKYVEIYEDATIYSEPLPLVTKDYVMKEIRDRLAGKIPIKAELNEVISILATPLEFSFIGREEEDLYKMGVEIQSNPKLTKLFKDKKVPAKKLGNFPIFQRIEKHQKNYCWIPYDYGVQLWNLDHFISMLKLIVNNKNCKAELAKIRNRPASLKARQELLFKKYQISGELKRLFEYIQLSTYIIDIKKEQFTKSHYLIIPLIGEIARRLHTSEVLVRFLTHEEIKAALVLGKTVDGTELGHRFELSVCVWNDKGSAAYIEPNKARDFIARNINENPEQQIGVKVYGTCACIGKWKGRAKIVMSSMHITKVESGDVLIAPMTSPDYIIGMKKAGAIVTDEGGITCHAAIISRELRIPCIVGTGNATKTFKDGDLIEVNANHGSVRKVEE